MNRVVLLLVLASFTGCQGIVDPRDLEGPRPGAADPLTEDLCPGGAELDFHVYGERLERHEGAAVIAVAREAYAADDPFTEATVVVRLQTEIQDGAFSLYCEASLTENYWYPSYALLIDVDGSGSCSPGDLSYTMQLYGWDRDVDDSVPLWFADPSVDPWQPIAADTANCGRFFE